MSTIVETAAPVTYEVDERIAAGVALLDEKCPGWENRINLDALNLQHCKHCVLGQLYGDYWDGSEKLDIDGREHSYGFDREHWRDARDWDSLTEQWRGLITRLRESAA